MKKKLFAALAAAAMLCCTLAAPVSAEETYKQGDINMDGSIDCADAILALQDFVTVFISENPKGYLTPEQLALAKCIPQESLPDYLASVTDEYEALLEYARIILAYSTECLAHPEYEEMEIAEWFPQSQFYARICG